MSMKTYEVTLAGFDPDSSKTDHLVKWVKAPFRQAIDLLLLRLGRPALYEAPHELQGGDKFGFEDGLDLVIDESGRIIEARIWQ